MFERLTVWEKANRRWIEDHSRDTKNWKNGYRECMKRLAAYEDSGLSPEEVYELAKAKAEGRISPVKCPCDASEEAQELMNAKVDGRLVELPCKVGDDVTIIFNDSGEEFITTGWILEEIIITEDDALCSFYCAITSEYEERSVVAFNKTVFLSREEAEKAFDKRNSIKLYPDCRVMGMYMTSVNNKVCRYFEPKHKKEAGE